MTKSNYKESYVRVILLKHDISIYHQDLNKEKDWVRKMRLFKNLFVSLDILRTSFAHFNIFLKNEEDLTTKAKSLRKRLEFINHLRNIISGHLDEKLITKAIQWEPFIFNKTGRNNEEGQIFLMYKSLMESAINSYIDSDSKQKVFDTGIDLAYSPDVTLFYNYIGELNCDAIDFLEDLRNLLKEKIHFWDESELLKMTKNAGETNFDLRTE